MIRRPASLHTVLRDAGVPVLHQYYQGAATSRRPSRRAWFPSLGGAAGALALRSPRSPTQDPETWTVAVRPARADSYANGDGRNSQVPGEPSGPFAVLFDPGRTEASDPFDAPTRPLLRERQGLPHWDFRGSFTRLSSSLSTLRRAGCPSPRKTRFRLLVRLCRAGFPPAGFLREVSGLLPYITVLLSQALLGAIPFYSSWP